MNAPRPVIAGILFGIWVRTFASQDWSPNMTLGPPPPTPTLAGSGGSSRPAPRGPSQAELDRQAKIYAHNAQIAAYRSALTLGDKAYDQGRFADARAQYEYMTRLLPHDINAFRLLGIALVRGGRYDEAEAALQQALANGLSRSQWAKWVAYIDDLRAQDCEKRGDYTGAAAWLKQSLQLKPDDPWSWDALGLVELNQGDYANAEAHIRASLKLKPNPEYQKDLQAVQYKIGSIRAQQTQKTAAGDIRRTAQDMTQLTGEASGAGGLGIDGDRAGNSTADGGQAAGRPQQVAVPMGVQSGQAGLAARTPVVNPLASRKADAQLKSVLAATSDAANTQNQENAARAATLGIDTPGEDSGAVRIGTAGAAPVAVPTATPGHLSPLEAKATNQLAGLRAERAKLDAQLQALTTQEAHEKDPKKMAALDAQVLSMQAEKAKNAVAITEGEEKIREIHQTLTLVETPENGAANPAPPRP